MEIYLIRHTETICEKGICYGQSNVGLLDDYQEKFELIKKQVPTDAAFYSSPLLRCTLLADYLSNSNYNVDARLLEMNFGDWEMKNWNDIAPEELNPWMKDFVTTQVPNGESFVDLHNRVNDFIENEMQKKISQPTVIVSHAGVIRSILCKISNLDLKNAFQNKVDFGEVIKTSI